MELVRDTIYRVMDVSPAQEVLREFKSRRKAPECLKLMAKVFQETLKCFERRSNTVEIFLLTVAFRVCMDMLNLPDKVYDLLAEKNELEGELGYADAAQNHQKHINEEVTRHFTATVPSLQQIVQKWSGQMDKLHQDLSELQTRYRIFKGRPKAARLPKAAGRRRATFERNSKVR